MTPYSFTFANISQICIVISVFPRLGTAWRHAGELAKDAEYLQEAEEIYRVVPGKDSPLFRCLHNEHALD